MKREIRCVLFHGCVAFGLATMINAVPAGAQTQSDENAPAAQQVADASESQAPAPQANEATATQVGSPIPTVQPQLAKSSWSSSAGFEGDTHNTGYGYFGPQYVHPFASKAAWIAGANVNYLYYQYANGSGVTNVRSPGVAAKGGVKLGGKNYLELGAGPSFKRRHIETKDEFGTVIGRADDTVVGVNFSAESWIEPTSHNSVYGIFDYSGSDGYKWSRLAYREQVSNRNWSGKFANFVGAEVIGQGNQDITSTQVGAFLEVVHVPSSISVMFRGGYKRSTFAAGPDMTGPWFAIGFWQRIR